MSTPSQPAPPVAIIGMACRFPGGPDVPSFWRLLREGGNAIIDVPADRWNLDALTLVNDGKPVPRNVVRGGWLPRVRDFDNTFFRMSPREARMLDPKQRLVLEVTYEALEDANLAPDQLALATAVDGVDGRTGVFIGTAQSEYLQRFFWRMEIGNAKADRYVGPGNDCSFTSGRISAMFGLDGPSVNVNTACSTSLVAVHQAIRAIQNGECDIAAAGGVAIIETPEHSLTMNQFGVLAPDSQCKAFDAGADGYVRAEGCGIVILRRLDDALAAGDRILAVVRGSAVNHNGLSDNMMAPEAEAQARLLRTALAVGGIDPATVDVIEAHGTGTTVGDPIEISALAEVFAAAPRPRPAWVASVKTNVGHLEVSAGIAGLIKAILCVRHAQVPKHLHLTKLNPAIDPNLPFTYPDALTPWPRPDGHPRRAVVNSFGISGINAAVVIEEASAPASAPVPQLPRPAHLLPLTAFGDTPLRALARSYADALAATPWAELAYTAATGRMHHPLRMVLQAATGEEAAAALRGFAETGSHPAIRTGDALPDRAKTALLFTGQGAQYAGMGRDVYDAEPVFRAMVDRCDAAMAPLVGRSVREVMFGLDTSVSIDDTAWTQPTLFVLELAMAELWRSWGVTPDVLVGHSIGEIAAAVFAGVMTVEDGCRLVAARGRLMQALPRDGAMAAIFADVETVRQALVSHGDAVGVASDNGATSTVISGRTEAVDAVCAAFEARQVGVRRLNVSHAFHSSLMDPMLAEFGAIAEDVPMRRPSIPILSNVTGQVAGDEIATPEYWVRHLRGAVRFREDMLALAGLGVRLVIEVGPDPVLAGMGRRAIPDHKATWVASLRRDRGHASLLDGVAEAWLAGGAVSWPALWRHHRANRVDLPRYPFQRRELWVEDPGPLGTVKALGGAAPVAAPPVAAAAPSYDRAQLYRLRWRPVAGYASAPVTPGTWIVGVDAGGVLEGAARQLEAAGHQVIRVRPGDAAARSGQQVTLVPGDPQGYRDLAASVGPALRGWVHGWSLDAPDDHAFTGAQWTSTAETTSLAHLFAAQAVIGASVAGAGLWLVTRGAEAVTPGEAPRLAQAGPWGVARVVALEHRALPNRRVDLDPAASDPASDLAALLLRPPADEDQLAFRKGGLHALRLGAHRPSGADLRPRPDGAWIVTGGLGALGLAVAAWLVEQGVSRVVLCGRSAPSDEARAAIARLEQAGATVLVEAVDVANPTHVRNLFQYIARKGVAVRGVIHAAGVLADGPVLRQDRERFYKVFAAKVEGAWNLHQATRDLDLDAFVLFSSVTSTLGAPGQVNYAAANAFLDALVWHRHHQGLPAVSVNWGPWGEIGMAAKLAELMASRGMGGLKTGEALHAMGQVASDLLPQVTFMDMRVREILAREPAFAQAPLFREIVGALQGASARPARPVPPVAPVTRPTPPAAPTVSAAAPPAFSALLGAMPQAARRDEVVRRVTALAAAQLGVEVGALSPTRPLAWQGFDSVMALDLQQQLRKALGADLDLQVVTVGPPVGELADAVLAKLALPPQTVPLPGPAAQAAPAAAPAASGGLRDRLAATAPGERAAVLTGALRAVAEELLGFKAGELDPKRPLAWQGFDSVMALDLQRRIQADLGVALKLDEVVSGPPVAELAADVLGRMSLPAQATAAAAPTTVVAAVAPTAPVAAPAPTGDRRAAILAFLVAEAEKLLGFNAGDLDANRPLAWQGFDSVMAVDLQKRIQAELGAALALDTLVGGPRLVELVDEVAAKATRVPGGPASAPAAPVASPVAPAAAPAGDWRAAVLAFLVAEAEKLLGFNAGDLDANRPLAWQGFDSVMAVDLQKRIQTELGAALALDTLVGGPRLVELVDEVAAKATKVPGAAAPARSAPTAPAAGPRDVLGFLVAEAEKLLGFNPGDLDPNRPLAWQGFDSVMAVDLQKRIQTELGVVLALDTLVGGPRLVELAAELTPKVQRPTPPAATTPPAVAPAAVPTPNVPPEATGSWTPVSASRPTAHPITAPPTRPTILPVEDSVDDAMPTRERLPPSGASWAPGEVVGGDAMEAAPRPAGDGRRAMLLMIAAAVITAIIATYVLTNLAPRNANKVQTGTTMAPATPTVDDAGGPAGKRAGGGGAGKGKKVGAGGGGEAPADGEEP